MKTTYETADLNLAAFLVVSWYEIMTMRKENNKWIFYFEDSDSLKRVLQDYFLWKTLIDPLKYSTTIKKLKTYIYNT